MTDYLLVHGAGQGAWTWGRVWGRMTAPEEHPPVLYKSRRANRVLPIDLPGHGADASGDTSVVRVEDCVQSIVGTVEREGLTDVVMVGHGFSAGLVLRAASELAAPPKRVVLVAGIVPPQQTPLISACARGVRFSYRLGCFFNAMSRRELKLARPAIDAYLCNDMDVMEVAQMLGFFCPLPIRLLNSRIALDDSLPSPLTYVVLTKDRLIGSDVQKRTAERLSSQDTVEIEACHQVMWEKPEELAEALMRYA